MATSLDVSRETRPFRHLCEEKLGESNSVLPRLWYWMPRRFAHRNDG
jgi:hypothetical protein